MQSPSNAEPHSPVQLAVLLGQQVETLLRKIPTPVEHNSRIEKTDLDPVHRTLEALTGSSNLAKNAHALGKDWRDILNSAINFEALTWDRQSGYNLTHIRATGKKLLVDLAIK